MNQNSKERFIEIVKNASMVGLITHKDGDGDAFGSMLGLARGLESIGKKTVIFSNEPISQIFDFINGSIKYAPKDEYSPVDILVGLDANSEVRFTIPEVVAEHRKAKKPLLVVDHHLPSDIKDVAEVYLTADGESCTSEMVLNILLDLRAKIDKTTANLLLIGIETDTFSMQFENTNPQTFEAVAELLRKGARLKPVVESAFGGKPISTVKLLGRAMNRLTLDDSGLLSTYVNKKDVSDLNLNNESSSGIANFIEQVEGAMVVAVFEERPEGMIKGSLRSNKSGFDVEKVAKKFGGGGHKLAAGFTTKGELKSIMDQVRKAILRK